MGAQWKMLLNGYPLVQVRLDGLIVKNFIFIFLIAYTGI